MPKLKAKTRDYLREPYVDLMPVLEPGKVGKAELSLVEITRHTAAMCAIQSPRETPTPGTYLQLKVDGYLVMSDTDMEQRSNWGAIRQARGDVLIGGLGFGFILIPMLKKPEVKKVVVVELEPDVISLIEPQLRRAFPRLCSHLEVVQGDILEWKPPKDVRFDTIYFDIWPEMCTTNLDQMTTLHRRFAKKKAAGGWMGSWRQDDLRYKRRQERSMWW